MKAKHLIAIVTTAIAFGAFGTVARADGTNQNDSSFSGMWKMDYIDKNKDGMVSKTEFMEMMTKAWEMKAKEMKIKNDMMSAEEFKKFKSAFLPG